MTADDLAHDSAQADALEALGLVHVPSVAELHAEGLAEEVVEFVGKSKQKRTSYRLSKKGQKRIYKAQAHNAAILRDLHLKELAARSKEKAWRSKADAIMHLYALASKGI